MLTVTKDLVLPCTVTGSWPRPRWFDVGLWGRPLDTCMLDVRFREKYLDAYATLISDEERAGLDLLTHGDFHCDDDFAGRSWHHYPLQRWAGFEGDLRLSCTFSGSAEGSDLLAIGVKAGSEVSIGVGAEVG